MVSEVTLLELGSQGEDVLILPGSGHQETRASLPCIVCYRSEEHLSNFPKAEDIGKNFGFEKLSSQFFLQDVTNQGNRKTRKLILNNDVKNICHIF